MTCLEGIHTHKERVMILSLAVRALFPRIRLPWKQLFEPVINLSRDGFEMTKHNGE